MVSTFILIYTLSVYKLFTYKSSIDFKLSLFLFTLIFLIYNCYPYLLLELRGINFYTWNSVNVEMKIINLKILTLTLFFYFFFLIGCKISFFFLSKIKVDYNYKIIFRKYNFSIIILLVIILLILSTIYKDIFFQNLTSYLNTIELKQYSIYFYLIYIILILFCILLSKERKVFNFYILLFACLITLYSFFSSDKNILLTLFSLLFYVYYKENNFKNLNLFKLFFFISVVLFIFLPFFSYFRTYRDVYNFYEWFKAGNYSFLSDPGGPLLSLKLITEDFVNLDTNFFHNFLSFLPKNLRELFDYNDLGVQFAKQMLGGNYSDGIGFGFSILAESYLYFKINFFLFIMFVVFVGFTYILAIQLISKKFVPHKFSLYIVTLLSVDLSFTISRSSYAALIQSSFRLLFIFIIIYFIYFFLKNLIFIKTQK